MKNVFALIAVMLICFVGVSKGNAPPGNDLTSHEIADPITADIQHAEMALDVQCYVLDAPFELYLSPPAAADVNCTDVAIVQVQNDPLDVSLVCNIPTPAARDVVLNDIEQLYVFSCTIESSLTTSKLIRSLNPFSGYWQYFY